jgi:PPOX class probable F420-dependent enzyme
MGAACAGKIPTILNPGASMTTDASPFAALAGEQFIVLTTFRQNGEAVPTTVWFAERDGKLYITTGAAAGKLKRIRSNPQVTLAPSDRMGGVTGAALPALAREARPDEYAIAEEALDAKYGKQLRAVRVSGPFRATSTHLVVTPAS